MLEAPKVRYAETASDTRDLYLDFIQEAGVYVERAGLGAQTKLGKQLGWAAGIHQTAVARIESGERKPTLETIFKLARGLEVPPADLFAEIE